MKILRILFLLAMLGMLGWGIYRERHEVRPLSEGKIGQYQGPAFTDGTTYDKFLLKNGQIFDAKSLMPAGANEKDCKT